jgi:hypothetical protein
VAVTHEDLLALAGNPQMPDWDVVTLSLGVVRAALGASTRRSIVTEPIDDAPWQKTGDEEYDLAHSLPQRPTTEVGRRHVARWFTTHTERIDATADILAIEAEAREQVIDTDILAANIETACAEARADALREAAERVRALPLFVPGLGPNQAHAAESMRDRAAAILDPQP